jgi:cytochrome c oxidase subunit 1
MSLTSEEIVSHPATRLDRTWAEPSGIIGWFCNVDHKAIGLRYIVTAFFFFLTGGILAVLMRLQLARPENNLLSPDLYNQIFTIHGSTMMFLFAVPIMDGLGTYLVPLMIGARTVAFPRLNAFGYYTYVGGGLLLYSSFLLSAGPDTGWFSYVPLAGPDFSPGKRVDAWAQTVTLTEISALVTGVVLIATIFKHRAPGMSLNRIPLFVWAMLVMSFMSVFALPAIVAATLFLALDRLVSTRFFDIVNGGDPILWQHLFWFFGHPEVYMIFIPALGIASSIIVAFTRQPLFGYLPVVLSLIATGFIGFGLWVHHMFTVGLPQLGESFFTAASLMIAIPSGVQIFCWLVSLWRGRLRMSTPLLFVLAFFFTFVIGGLTGVMIASVPFDKQVHDTYFIVAHFHYTLIGGAVFPLFGGLYYWFPKFTGRMLSPRLGMWHFWLFFIGFNLTFFPLHQAGLQGMPRRIYTYASQSGWTGLSVLATAGGAIMAISILLFLANVAISLIRGKRAAADPWTADTLEWSVPSPPPPYNFAEIPVVEGRSALWDRSPRPPVVVGIRTDRREVLATTVLDARPDHRVVLPGSTIWPFLFSIVVVGSIILAIFTPWAAVVLFVLGFPVMFGWFWSESWTAPSGSGQTDSNE